MTTRDLERIQKLISLASSPDTPEEEARSSALVAVRMIRKIGAVVALPREPAKPLTKAEQDFLSKTERYVVLDKNSKSAKNFNMKDFSFEDEPLWTGGTSRKGVGR